MQSAILDVVINAHHGQVNPILLTPKQLKAQLGLIKEHIPPNLRLPVANDHLLEVYKLLTIESKISTNEIIFRIRLPLLTNEIFEIFNVVPIPIPVNTTYVAIESSTEFLMINLHRDLYYPLSKAELSQCTTIGQATHICRPHHPLYRKGAAQGACELSILTQAAQMQNCKLSTVQHVTKWRQLITPNQWMYVLNQETMINVICGTTIKRRTLTGSGILTVTAGCRVTDEVTTIQAYNSYATSFNSSIVPQKNITEMMHPAQLSRLAHPVLSQMNITEDIVKLKNTIHMLQNEEHRNLKHTSTHYLSIGYSGLGLTTIMLLYLAYRMIRKCRSGQKKHVSASPTTAADFVLNQQA